MVNYKPENGGMAFAAIQSGHHSIDFSQADLKPFPPQSKPFLPLYYNNMNLTEVAEIFFLIFLWYASSSLTNNLNKTILADDIFPFPYSLTLFQFGSIALCCYIMTQMSRSHNLQSVNTNFAKLVIPLCASQIIAHLLTQSSLQHVPVSFTHTIKGCSPIFAILLSRYYNFNERYSWTLFAGVFAIIGGVILSSINEINFNFWGFITALGSTLVFSWQNAFSKKIFRDKEMDHINLLFYTSSFAFVMMLPVWFIYDLPHILAFQHLKLDNLWALLLLDGICHFGQNIAAFTFMTKVTPLTYTVFNTFKRTFVIISAILYFGNSVNFFNALGIALTTAGVALYNKAKLDMRSK